MGEKKLPEHTRNIVIVSTIAASEVHPAEVVHVKPDANEDHDQQNQDHQDQEKNMDQSPV